MNYTLSQTERAMLQKLQGQYADAEKAMRDAQASMVAIKGAVNGAVQLIASQQGLTPKGNESISVSDDLSTITVISRSVA